MEIELLAPVGSYEAFKSAIDNGANAIYLAGTKFGAREKATFTNDELIDIIKEAHINEVKVYVTVNTLIYDDEFEEVIKFIDFLYNNDCDAIIVQDLGLITVVRNMYPDLVIHASTQMNTMTIEQARLLKNMGVKRVVLARETNIETIKKIIKEVGIEVEVFVHGALCVSYSGECLFSSCLTKKSGNRGECLQLCRLPYSLYKEGEKIVDNQYLLSMRDLNTINYVNEFIDANVTSLKIEGRLKSGSYVGLITKTYRKYIDKYVNEGKVNIENSDYKNMAQVFNREFTKGYIFKDKNSQLTNINRPNNMGIKIGKVIDYRNGKAYVKLEETLHQGDGIRIVGKTDVGFCVNKMEVKRLLVNTANINEVVAISVKEKVEINDLVYKTNDIKLNEEIEKNKTKRKFAIDAQVDAFIGQKLKMKFKDNLNNVVEATSDYTVIEANNSPTSREKIAQQISKLNDTSYFLKDCNINCDERVLIPVSVINETRRNLVEKLNGVRSKVNIRKGKKKLQLDKVDVVKEEFSLKVKVSNDSQYDIVKDYVNEENIYYTHSDNIYPYPRISENKIKVNNKQILINELHDITNKEMIANCYLNCTNIFTLYTLYKLGFKRVTLSVEMTKNRIVNLINNYKEFFKETPNLEVIVYSKIDLLITKYCLINKCLNKENMGCKECEKHKFYLEDRKGYKIPIVRDYYCNTKLLNPRALMLLDYVDDMENIGISCVRIEFDDENINECKEIMEYHFNKNTILDSRKFTYGYYKEKEDD